MSAHARHVFASIGGKAFSAARFDVTGGSCAERHHRQRGAAEQRSYSGTSFTDNLAKEFLVQNLEAMISFCDPLNPGFGYQIRITRAAPPGAPVDVLFTSRHPVTGEDLLTYEQCLDVLTMYRNSPDGKLARPGFILRATSNPQHFFHSRVRDEMLHVEDRDCAWFTTDRSTANVMALDLARHAGEAFEVVSHVHGVPCTVNAEFREASAVECSRVTAATITAAQPMIPCCHDDH